MHLKPQFKVSRLQNVLRITSAIHSRWTRDRDLLRIEKSKYSTQRFNHRFTLHPCRHSVFIYVPRINSKALRFSQFDIAALRKHCDEASDNVSTAINMSFSIKLIGDVKGIFFCITGLTSAYFQCRRGRSGRRWLDIQTLPDSVFASIGLCVTLNAYSACQHRYSKTRTWLRTWCINRWCLYTNICKNFCSWPNYLISY